VGGRRLHQTVEFFSPTKSEKNNKIIKKLNVFLTHFEKKSEEV